MTINGHLTPVLLAGLVQLELALSFYCAAADQTLTLILCLIITGAAGLLVLVLQLVTTLRLVYLPALLQV
jgi:hypothetical protein